MARRKNEVTESPVDEAMVEEKNVVEESVAEKTTEEISVNENDSENNPEKKKKKISKISVKGIYEKLKVNFPVIIWTSTITTFVVVILALVCFFIGVEGAEKVMVPEVVGKPLEEGLLVMQEKQLYPSISLRYSDTPGDEGTILDQNPQDGAIVRGYSRVSLVVSRGVIANKVGNYVGITLDEMKMNLQTLFAGSTKPLILVGNVVYKADTADAGTILEQDPPEGTGISDPVHVNLVVSRGPQYENTKPPVLTGKSINDVLQTITRSKLIFDFTSHIAQEGEIPGTVVDQQKFNSEFVSNYTHVTVDIAIPETNSDGNIYGVYEKVLDVYPYAVPMRLDAVPEEGDTYTIINFNHTGGSVTIPYIVPSGTTLILYAGDKVAGRETIR